jgi:hypothetical protein
MGLLYNPIHNRKDKQYGMGIIRNVILGIVAMDVLGSQTQSTIY